jgi:hypothetical protein
MHERALDQAIDLADHYHPEFLVRSPRKAARKEQK